jgi:hypothetical protein
MPNEFFEKREGFEFYQGQPIKGIRTATGPEYQVGYSHASEEYRVEKIEVVLTHGQMAYVPWFLVTFINGREAAINAALCEIVWLA